MIKHSLRVKYLNLTLITNNYDKKHYIGTNNSLRKNMYDFTIRWLYKKMKGEAVKIMQQKLNCKYYN